MIPNPTVGDKVFCWPLNQNPKPTSDGSDPGPLVCLAFVCSVTPTDVWVHYYLPDGANGSCALPVVPAAEPRKGAWWWGANVH